jgi:hypothetical protein
MDFNMKMAIAIVVFMAVLLRFGSYIFERPPGLPVDSLPVTHGPEHLH